MSTIVETISRYLEHAAELVAGAEATGVPLPVAAAVMQVESGGRNVFGNDAGGMFATPDGPDLEVTEERHHQLYEAVVPPREADPAAAVPMNGEGPMQITWWKYLQQAGKAGVRLWIPVENIKFGLGILKGFLDQEGGDVARAATLYNAGSLKSGVNDYGRRVAAEAEVWASRLRVDDTPAAPEPVDPVPAPEPPSPQPPAGPAPVPPVESAGEVVVEVVTEELTAGTTEDPVTLEDGSVLVVHTATLITRRRTYPSRRTAAATKEA